MKIKYQHYRTRKQDAGMLPARGRPPDDKLYIYSKEQHDFMPHERGGATLCRVELEDGTEIRARATCSMSDPFCYARGRNIALGRAMKNPKVLLSQSEGLAMKGMAWLAEEHGE